MFFSRRSSRDEPVLASHPNLESLDLRRTKASAASIAELQKALPNCKIEWDGGGSESGQK